MLRDLDNPLQISKSIASASELSGTTAVVGTAVDMSAIVGPVLAVVSFSAASGSPSGQEHVIKVQESDASNGSGATDIADATATVTVDGDTVKIQADNRTKRYVRVHITPAFTGGTTPKATACAVLIAQKERY